MVDPTNKAAYQAHINATWHRIIQDLAVRGMTDQDVVRLETETDWENAKPIRWRFLVEITGDRSPLVYCLDNRKDAQITIDGKFLQTLGEA